jgi:hypothetical protein
MAPLKVTLCEMYGQPVRVTVLPPMNVDSLGALRPTVGCRTVWGGRVPYALTEEMTPRSLRYETPLADERK